MTLEPWLARLLDAEPVGRLATTDGERPHCVPVVFVRDGRLLYTPIDGKPKRANTLKRVANVRARPAVSLLIDHYEDDWAALWWVRIDGNAAPTDTTDEVAHALAAKYRGYRTVEIGRECIRIEIARAARWAPNGTPYDGR